MKLVSMKNAEKKSKKYQNNQLQFEKNSATLDTVTSI